MMELYALQYNRCLHADDELYIYILGHWSLVLMYSMLILTDCHPGTIDLKKYVNTLFH